MYVQMELTCMRIDSDLSNGGPRTIEELTHALGDCGLFQIIFVIITHGACLPSEWSFTFMSFGNYDPGWTCNDSFIEGYNNQSHIGTNGSDVSSDDFSVENQTLSNHYSCNIFNLCENVIFSKDSNTIVTEWHLLCGQKWVTSLMISLQMGGSIIGNFIAGIFNNKFGRKPTHFGGLLVHIALNVIAAFSNSWQMFAVMRFFIGMTSAYLDVTQTIYPMELITNRWRGILSGLPFSHLSGVLFGLMSMGLRDWRMIHLVTAMATLLFFLPVFWVPESIRWLAIRGEINKASKVVDTIARINKKDCPNKRDIIRNIADGCTSNDAEDHSMLDLYRNGFLSRTLILAYSVVSAVVCFVVVRFGVRNLTGNFYINLILFSLIPSVSLPIVPILSNTIGRKCAQLILIALQCVCCIILASLHAWGLNYDVSDTLELVVALLMIAFTDAQWSLAFLGNIELYPTTLRSLGFSHSNGVGKLFAMAAPFLIPYDSESNMIPYILLSLVCGVNFILNLFLPETKDKHLEDYTSIPE